MSEIKLAYVKTLVEDENDKVLHSFPLTVVRKSTAEAIVRDFRRRVAAEQVLLAKKDKKKQAAQMTKRAITKAAANVFAEEMEAKRSRATLKAKPAKKELAATLGR